MSCVSIFLKITCGLLSFDTYHSGDIHIYRLDSFLLIPLSRYSDDVDYDDGDAMMPLIINWHEPKPNQQRRATTLTTVYRQPYDGATVDLSSSSLRISSSNLKGVGRLILLLGDS